MYIWLSTQCEPLTIHTLIKYPFSLKHHVYVQLSIACFSDLWCFSWSTIKRLLRKFSTSGFRTNTYFSEHQVYLLQASLDGTSKGVLSMERMSPASVDSGFDSSFPSSPDCSLDSPISTLGVGAETTKYLKSSGLKRHRNTGAPLQRDVVSGIDVTFFPHKTIYLFFYSESLQRHLYS